MLDSSLISEFFSLIISLVLLANVTQKKWRYIEQHLFYADQYDGSLYDVLCFAGYIRA